MPSSLDNATVEFPYNHFQLAQRAPVFEIQHLLFQMRFSRISVPLMFPLARISRCSSWPPMTQQIVSISMVTHAFIQFIAGRTQKKASYSSKSVRPSAYTHTHGTTNIPVSHALEGPSLTPQIRTLGTEFGPLPQEYNPVSRFTPNDEEELDPAHVSVVKEENSMSQSIEKTFVEGVQLHDAQNEESGEWVVERFTVCADWGVEGAVVY